MEASSLLCSAELRLKWKIKQAMKYNAGLDFLKVWKLSKMAIAPQNDSPKFPLNIYE